MKTIIERGASWTLEETKLLLGLWGEDLVQRQGTNLKRTKEVYDKISDRFRQAGFERTAEQVRTRVFNMIAEYRRILKDPTPDRMKKCIFFDALDRIYSATHMDEVKSALDDYEPEYLYSPASNTIESESDSEATDGNETATTNNNNNNIPTSATNINTTINNTTITNPTSINNTINDNNNGDSNNNTAEKESSLANSHPAGGAAAKKIKLESPKSGQNQTSSSSSIAANQANLAAASTSSINTSSGKQTKSSSSIPIAAAATTPGTPSVVPSSSQRHQSLLLPHATTSTSSTTPTPISKITTPGSNNTPSYININSTKLPIIRTNQLIGHSNGNESINLNGTATRLPTTAAITSHQLYQAPVNTFDVTSSALLIDRMFAHLSRESENMREWIALEKERLALERARRQQETEREIRRERVLIDTLMRFQEQWLTFLSRLDARVIENSNEPPPELRIPPKDAPSADTSQSTNSASLTTNSTNPPTDASK